MKKQLLVLCIVSISINAFAQIPPYIPTNGLVGWWPFTGNANDSSGNGNNGTVTGATLTQDRFGNANRAYFFTENANQYIDVPQSSSLNNCPQITISLWTKVASWSRYNSFINKSDQAGSNSWALTNENIPSDSLVFYFGNWPNWLSSPIVPSVNQWHHLAITYSFNGSTGKCHFYIDGTATDSFTTTTYLPINTYIMRIGSYANIGYNTVNGSLDDIAIWNRALTPAEISSVATDINELNSHNSFSIYPNPSTNKFTISFGKAMSNGSLKIFNIIGEEVYNERVNGKQQTINTKLGAGIYFVCVSDDERQYVQKIVVE